MNKLDVLALINPQMKAVLAKEDELAGNANDTSVGFEEMREAYIEGRSWWNEGGPETRTEEVTIDGPYGDIALRCYYPIDKTAKGTPDDQALLPGIIFAHGGGFVLGNLDTHDRICRILAARTGAAIVAVDYRLSPEAKYPSAVKEVAAVASYMHEQGENHNIDGERLSFAGDSGGANLSTAALFYLHNEFGDSSFVRCLLLFYGWFGLQDSMSMRLLGGPWDGLSEEDWQFYMSLYANDPVELGTSPYANLFLNDLGNVLPACYIAAADLDPLRDDSATLAAVCEAEGVPYRHEVFKGVLHGFLHYTKMLDEASDALEHAATFYRQQLGLV